MINSDGINHVFACDKSNSGSTLIQVNFRWGQFIGSMDGCLTGGPIAHILKRGDKKSVQNQFTVYMKKLKLKGTIQPGKQAELSFPIM